ncbi:Uncharacterised protein [Serratia quinivorans]|nr:Uncharacterised protein [Serratia quinivorans]CAI0822699.1 Uncharacterised protein [Serratia quinivorans]CAI0845651.1 Uncharacterised protein [Serratia quinivorans]CAI1497647.1 Uncharacterised protein [Serratia quinivorans]CAI2036831.1 Uncharacterised protein [Serratia quinivorans]
MALTPQQIASLQQDIVWLVSETVQTADGPQTVWVPKVYLAQTTLRLTGDIAVTGSQLKAGKDLSLDAARDITLQSAQNSESTIRTLSENHYDLVVPQ